MRLSQSVVKSPIPSHHGLGHHAGGPLFAIPRIGTSKAFVEQLLEDGIAPPPEGGQYGTNESAPVALWPDPDDGSKAQAAKDVPQERVS